MTRTFLDTLRKTIDAEWAQIKQGAFWRRVMDQPVSRPLYRDLMLQVYHYSRHNSMNQAVAAFIPAPEGLLKFVYRHAAEELGHERMVTHDLKTIDLFTEADLGEAPLPATEALIGYLYYVALRYGPVARLGYSFWAEGVYGHIAGPFAKISQDLQLTSRNLTFFGSHAQADEAHIQQVTQAIERFAITPEEQALVIKVARTTLSLTGQLLDQVARRHRRSRQRSRGHEAIRSLFEQFKAYHAHGRPIVQYTGMVGIAAYPLFYLLRFTKTDPPYNDLWLRALGTLICVGLALRGYWPNRLKPYYLAYSYGALLYCLPFFFIFTSLTNGGGVVAVANTLMAVFFLILLSDWRNSVLMLVVGGAAATLLYIQVVPDPVLPMDYVARLPIVVLVMVGGSLFKFAEKQAEAEKVKRTYTALAGSIAHEMRNPLSQIKHNLESMQQALPLPTTSEQPQAIDFHQVNALYSHLAQSELAVQRGLQVIAMTLDEVSAKPIDTTAFSYLGAADATEKAVQEYGYENELDRSRVSVQVIEDFSFRGDETAYLFVLFNLIKNALYYITLYPDARVTITVERQRVKVRDSGPGIAPEMLARLFEPFRSTGKSGGTGLGLAYCQRVMRAFGGEIVCESVLGEYTQFTLRFPPISKEDSDTHLFAVLAKAQAVFTGKRILVVDDDLALRTITRHKLQPMGATIDEAADGLRALEMLTRQHYDLIVLDLNMPVLDGYAVAERIRQGHAPASRDVCMVAYTSEPAHLASVKTQKAGMDGFVTKPCAQLPLVQALHHALEHSAARVRSRTTQLAGRRILLADDNLYNRKAVAAYLKHAGVTVLQASHGQAVLELLQTQGGCDAILMDINMPGMNGLDTTRAIRRSPAAWRDVPVIALTAHSDAAIVQAAEAAGMNDFITKPVDAGTLYEKLHQLMVHAPAAQAAGAPPPEPAGTALLNLERLESYRRLGMLEELVNDYLPEITRLVGQLEQAVAGQDLQASLQALHSLLGISGEAGALALYQSARRVYVPMLEEHRWPGTPGWMEQIKTLTRQTEQALRAYGTDPANPARINAI